MLKRFLVFSYDTWEPDGGWHDFDSSFDFLDEATSYGKGLKKCGRGIVEIVDTLPEEPIIYYIDKDLVLKNV